MITLSRFIVSYVVLALSKMSVCMYSNWQPQEIYGILDEVYYCITLQGPFSLSFPVIELQPGPPLSHTMTGSSSGLSSDSTNLEITAFQGQNVCSILKGRRSILKDRVSIFKDRRPINCRRCPFDALGKFDTSDI